MAEMKMNTVRSDFGIAKWFRDDGPLAVAAGELVEAVVAETFEESPPYAFLPFENSMCGSDGIGGAPVEDPLVVYFSVPLGEHIDEFYTVYSICVADLVSEVIDGLKTLATGKIDGEDEVAVVKSMAAALRAQADRLDEISTPA